MVLGLLAARTGMILDYSNIARDSGIQSVTVKEWIGILQRRALVYCLQLYASNLNKRLTKAPKLYFLDNRACRPFAAETGIISCGLGVTCSKNRHDFRLQQYCKR